MGVKNVINDTGQRKQLTLTKQLPVSGMNVISASLLVLVLAPAPRARRSSSPECLPSPLLRPQQGEAVRSRPPRSHTRRDSHIA